MPKQKKSESPVSPVPEQIGTSVGHVEGKQLRFLAHVARCGGERCRIYDLCPYGGEVDRSERCALLHRYLKSMYQDWVDPKNGLGDVLTQMQLDRLGSHVMPLYHHLALFALEIADLPETTFTNKQGNWMVYPQFGEMRATMTQIRAEMKDLKLEALWEKKFGGGLGLDGGSGRGMPSTGGMMDLDTIMQHGRVGAYEELVDRAHKREE